MVSLFGIGFGAPWLLLGLIVLPALWLLLRAVPPAPVKRFFPGVILLFGLRDDDRQTARTPWWLLLLRSLAIAALIIGFAEPVLNPKKQAPATGPLLILMDGTWADAPDWDRRMSWVKQALDQAARDARLAMVVSLNDTPPGGLQFQGAQSWLNHLPSIVPAPWEPDPEDLQLWVQGLKGSFDTFWLSDGLDRSGRQDVLRMLGEHGRVQIYQNMTPVYALAPPVFSDGVIKLEVLRSEFGSAAEQVVLAHGLDPAGIQRVLGRERAVFGVSDEKVRVELNLPTELRNRITYFSIESIRSAGAISLGDDALKRRKVAIVAGTDNREGLQLLSPVHFLEQALNPTAELIDGTLGDILRANPDVIILADVASLTPEEATGVSTWVNDGGLLLRFAGPRLAASDISRGNEDDLMPVRLRVGGRMVGGAMSWGKPKLLAPFAEGSPFFGLQIPDDVSVSAQVLAEPDPTLSQRVIAALSDGTPLVTRKKYGSGQVVLFHVTANAQWSTLPLSGLFVQMLERLAVSSARINSQAEDLAGTIWQPQKILDGFGTMQSPGNLAGVPGEILTKGIVGPGMPPGLYSGRERVIAANVITKDTMLGGPSWPAGTEILGFSLATEKPLAAWFLLAALALLATDVIASIWIGGRLLRTGLATVMLPLAAVLIIPYGAKAQDDTFAIEATAQTVLAHVITGNSTLDDTAQAGLRGLSDILFARSSIEPADPIAVDLEKDELAFFPLLYWPITPDQPQPSDAAYARLNRYLRGGGMILFDTRDGDIARFGAGSVNGRKLQQLARPLDIPPLEPVPSDHVLTRTYYLLQEFPGRYRSPELWVEASFADDKPVEGMPFRDLNDNVSPVVIGGNDWASAWAVDPMGGYMFPVGRGGTGKRQREMAYRFGVNLVMYVLTGNYKSDQVHVPALLERLGE